jgi:ribosomal protein L23
MKTKTIVLPIITAKSSVLMRLPNKVKVFKVATWATKKQIQKALEEIFLNVKIVKVTTTMVRAKKRNFKRIPGVIHAWKKAYVTLAAGMDIEFS